MSKPFALFIPISKVDTEKRLVYGTITEETPDSAGEILDYASAVPAFKTWSEAANERSGGKSVGNLRAMHSSIAAGKFIDINYDDEAKRIEGVAKVTDDNEWAKVLDGVYTGFSIGGSYDGKPWPDPNNPSLRRYTPKIAEVSIVDNPAVPTATFQMIKADGSTEIRHFKETTKMTKPQVEQVWKARDGSTFEKKEQAVEHEAQLDALETVQKSVGPANQALHDLEAELSKKDGKDKEKKSDDKKEEDDDADKSKKDETKKDDMEAKKTDGEDADRSDQKETADKDGKGKKPYGDVDYADPGHQSDKKKRYPVDTEKHIRAAWSYINKPKNADKYSAEDLKSVKAKIVSAWKKVIDEKGPPEAADKSFRAWELQKGLDQCARAACLIQELDWLQDCIEWEAEFERDGSTQPEALNSIIEQLCGFLRDLVEEETAELCGDGEMTEKSFKDELAKRGARHNKSDMDIMGKIKEHADGIHKCLGDMGYGKAAGEDDDDKDGQDAEKAASAELLQKSLAENAEFKKNSAEMTEVIKSLAERVKQIEATPMPGGPVRSAAAISKAVEKGHETQEIGDESVEAKLPNFNGLSPAEARQRMTR